MLCVDGPMLSMRAVVGIDIVSIVGCRCPSITLVYEKVIQGSVVTYATRQPHPHATDGNWYWIRSWGLNRADSGVGMSIGVPIGHSICVAICVAVAEDI